MTKILKHRVSIPRLVLGAVLWCTFTGCTGPLVYRPEKKPVPVIAVAPANRNLPPAPDTKANNTTLAGIDTTGTGIRDDVYIWIYTNYTSTRMNIPLTKMAKTLQTVIVTPPKTSEDASKFKQSLNDALLHLKAVPGIGSVEAEKMDLILYEKTVNTPERLKSYLHYNLLQSGTK